jgi:hypothetical protein
MLSDHALATHRFRMPGRQHLVQDRDADGCFSLLGSKTACSQPRSDQSLVSPHRRFNERALTIICCFLPGQSSLLCDHLQMTITLRGRTLFTAGYAR